MVGIGIGVSFNRRGGGVAAPAAPIYAPSTYGYTSNFAALPNGTLLADAPGWSAINRNGNNSLPSRNDAIITNPGAVISSIDADDPLPPPNLPGDYLYAVETGSTRHLFEADVTPEVFSYMQVSGTHNGDHTNVRLKPASTAAWTWSGPSGSETLVVQPFSNLPFIESNTARFIEGRDIVTAQNNRVCVDVFDGRGFLKINGAPFGDFPITTAGTKVGFVSTFLTHAGFKNIRATALRTRFNLVAGKGWYNRRVGLNGWAGGGRRITRSFTWSGEEPTGIYWRLVRPTDGSVIKNWVGCPFADTVITVTGGTGVNKTGTGSITFDVQYKLDGPNPYRLEIGGRTDGTFGVSAGGTCNADTDCTQDFGLSVFFVTKGIVAAGQSEMIGSNGNIDGVGFPDFPGGCWHGVPQSTTELAYADCTPWRFDQNDGNTLRDRQSAWPTKILVDAEGGPVSISFIGYGANSARDLTPGGFNWPNIQAQLGHIGHFEELWLNQGSAEMNSSGVGFWQDAWATGIPAYFDYANQPASHVKRTYFVPTGFGNVPGEVGTAQQIQQANDLRAIQATFPAYMASLPVPYEVIVAGTFLDLEVDGIGEFTNGVRSGGKGLERIAITQRKVQYGGAYDGRGALVSTVQKISNTLIRITYALNGGTSISGTGLLGHKCYADAAGTIPIVVTSAGVINATQIDVVIALTPGNVWWSDYRDFGPSQTGRAITNYADPSINGIPVFFSPVPILAT